MRIVSHWEVMVRRHHGAKLTLVGKAQRARELKKVSSPLNTGIPAHCQNKDARKDKRDTQLVKKDTRDIEKEIKSLKSESKPTTTHRGDRTAGSRVMIDWIRGATCEVLGRIRRPRCEETTLKRQEERSSDPWKGHVKLICRDSP